LPTRNIIKKQPQVPKKERPINTFFGDETHLQVEKDYAKARAGVVHEVRLAKEAEADMDKHVTKAERLARKELAKHGDSGPRNGNEYGSYMNSDQRAAGPIGAGNATTNQVKIASPSQASSAPPSNELL